MPPCLVWVASKSIILTFKDSKGDTTTFSQHSILMERLTPIKKKLSDKIRNTNTLNGNVNVIQVADVNDFIKDITTFMVKMKMKMDGYNHPIKYIYELAGDRFKWITPKLIKN